MRFFEREFPLNFAAQLHSAFHEAQNQFNKENNEIVCKLLNCIDMLRGDLRDFAPIYRDNKTNKKGKTSKKRKIKRTTLEEKAIAMREAREKAKEKASEEYMVRCVNVFRTASSLTPYKEYLKDYKPIYNILVNLCDELWIRISASIHITAKLFEALRDDEYLKAEAGNLFVKYIALDKINLGKLERRWLEQKDFTKYFHLLYEEFGKNYSETLCKNRFNNGINSYAVELLTALFVCYVHESTENLEHLYNMLNDFFNLNQGSDKLKQKTEMLIYGVGNYMTMRHDLDIKEFIRLTNI